MHSSHFYVRRRPFGPPPCTFVVQKMSWEWTSAPWSGEADSSNAAWRSDDPWNQDHYGTPRYRANEHVDWDEVTWELGRLASEVTSLKEECDEHEREMNALRDEKMALVARVVALERSRTLQHQQLSLSTARGSDGRRRRPRSGSLPPDDRCVWHELGNSIHGGTLPDYGLTTINNSTDAYDWWNHVQSTMFSTRARFAAEVWKWLERQFARNRIHIGYYFSSNVRHFIINCNQCDEKFIACYDKNNKTTAEKDLVLEQLAAFTQLTQYLDCVSYCPRKQHDTLLALTF